MFRETGVPLVACVVAALGCAHETPAQGAPKGEAAGAEARPSSGDATAAAAACFVYVPDTRVSMAETPSSVVLTYTTQPNNVGTLQEELRALAQQQNGPPPSADALAAGSLTSETGAPPGAVLLAPGAHAQVTDTETGARLSLEPVPEPIRRLFRREVAEHDRVGGEARCPPVVRVTPSLPGGP